MGIGEVAYAGRLATLAAREGENLAARGAYSLGGRAAFTGARVARAERDAAAVSTLVEQGAGLSLPASQGDESPLAYIPVLDLIPAYRAASRACNPK